ncbi:MAG: hypothetical protein GXO65_00995 [Euryarchaeota archaeon]|nr:hypothetical protein [Euryarchaeota archaeon]
MHEPPKGTRYLAWLILGSLSVFFAEVVSGSDMFPYFTPWGILVVIPLYTLHILVLSCIVFRYGRPRFYTLFLAGTIFGMYEAYITKVLWDPTWGDALVKVGGVALVESVVLVLWWHPVMAFVIPLFAGEHLLSNSRETAAGLPGWLKVLYDSPRSLPAFALMCGLIQSGNSPSPVHSLLSGISTTAFLILLIYIWRQRTGEAGYAFVDLLPTRRELMPLSALLVSFYIVTGAALRPEALPGPGPQLAIWMVYGILFALLYRSLRRSRGASLEAVAGGTAPPLRECVKLALVFTAASAASSAFGLGGPVMALNWFGGALVGIWLLVRSVADLK